MILFISNVLWLSAGIIATLAVIGIIKKVNVKKSTSKPPVKLESPTKNNTDSITHSNNKFKGELTSTTSVSIDSSSDKSKNKEAWEPAIVAVRRNLTAIFALLGGVSVSRIDNMEEWKNLLISIHNDDLIDMWRDVITRPNLWITYLQTFGIQQDLTSEFTYLPEYVEMYSCIGEEFKVGEVYTVISPCWIYTNADNNQSVALRGKAIKKHLI